ncbi:MAG: PIG-L family deacetylase [Proteobacteria bacterium]|nr:PIG-L family deacetylase [Pseudomonadota bacterium]
MKILAIGAHPDDIEAGCSGTLAKYARNGHDIYMLIMTEGHMGGEGSTRKKEQKRSAKILKPRELIWGGYKDTLLTPHMNQMVHDIEVVLKKIAPDFIFVHYEDDTHQDHRALAKATISATRYVRNVLFYEGPTTQNFSPAVFVDIRETLDDKVAMLHGTLFTGSEDQYRGCINNGHRPLFSRLSRNPGTGPVRGGFRSTASVYQYLTVLLKVKIQTAK